MTEPNRQPTGGGRWWLISRCIGNFADLFLGPMLVNAGEKLGPSHAHPGPAEAATNCGCLVVPNRLPRASHRQYLTLPCTSTNIHSGELQTSEQDLVSFISGISIVRSWQAPDPA